MAAKAGKDLGFSILLDYYGMVLTEKQRNILTEYYNDDLSLAEIAENYGITRQGVRDAIKHMFSMSVQKIVPASDKFQSVERHASLYSNS